MPTLTPLEPEYSVNTGRVSGAGRQPSLALLAPDRVPDHIDALYRAAYALCGSRHDAEDLVQETFSRVLKRARSVRRGHELGYLLKALRNTYYSDHRAAARRPTTAAVVDEVNGAPPQGSLRANAIMHAIASAPPAFRDAVIAIDILGMSYKEAARALRARQGTITSRLHRGRQHVAAVLDDDAETR